MMVFVTAKEVLKAADQLRALKDLNGGYVFDAVSLDLDKLPNVYTVTRSGAKIRVLNVVCKNCGYENEVVGVDGNR